MSFNLSAYIQDNMRNVQDFPREGILFRDLSPILAQREGLYHLVRGFDRMLEEYAPTHIVGIDARGFIYGAAVAADMMVPFIPSRKLGKLPPPVVFANYELEYGKAQLEMSAERFPMDARVVIIDDVLATGGTAYAAAKLVGELGGEVVALAFVLDLGICPLTEIAGAPILSLCKLEG